MCALSMTHLLKFRAGPRERGFRSVVQRIRRNSRPKSRSFGASLARRTCDKCGTRVPSSGPGYLRVMARPKRPIRARTVARRAVAVSDRLTRSKNRLIDLAPGGIGSSAHRRAHRRARRAQGDRRRVSALRRAIRRRRAPGSRRRVGTAARGEARLQTLRHAPLALVSYRPAFVARGFYVMRECARLRQACWNVPPRGASGAFFGVSAPAPSTGTISACDLA